MTSTNEIKAEVLSNLNLDGTDQTDPLSEDDIDVDNCLYLFISYDLVNSTQYKSHDQDWPIVIEQFFNIIEQKLKAQNPTSNAKLWRYAGDEILFYMEVRDENVLPEALQTSYEVLLHVVNYLHRKYTKTKTILSAKGAMWCARVGHLGSLAMDQVHHKFKKLGISNILVKIEETTTKRSHIDFLGQDIDLGFRMSKHVVRKRFVVSADLAYLLIQLKNSDRKNNELAKSLLDKMKIVSYKFLKGIWNNRRYPIIWFDKANWNRIEETFLYDEKYNYEIVNEIISRNGEFQTPDYIIKILEEVGKLENANSLWEYLTSLEKKDEKQVIEVPMSKLAEIHCAAICINEKNEVLLAKRGEHKRIFASCWEFGCGQLRLNESIGDCLKRSYHDDFGVELELGKKLIPIDTYEIRSNDVVEVVVPGIIFLAHIKGQQVELRKHKDYRWLPLEDVENFEEETVPNLKQNILDAKMLWDREKSNFT